MKQTVKIFFHIIASVLKGTAPNTEGFSDWQKLYHLAKGQSCVSYLYYALKDNVDLPKEVADAISKDTVAVRNQQAQQDYYAERLFDALHDEGVDYAEMKGRTLRCLYPYSDLRPSCDIDFLYRKGKANRKAVFRVIEEMGGKYLSSYLNDDAFSLSSVVSVEAHHSLMATDEFYDEYYQDIWDRLQKTERDFEYTFSPKESFLYCLIHAKKHFMLGGCGVRAIIDLYVLKRNSPNLFDQEMIEDIKRLKVYKFNLMVDRLCECWLDGREMDEEEARVTRYILQGGTLGSSQNEAIAQNVGKDVKKTRLKYFLRKVFPSYKELTKNYKVLKPLPILLPFVWAYRWIKILFTNKGRVKKEMEISSKISHEMVEMVNKVFESVSDE